MKQKSKHPEWALKHKVKGTELRCIRGKYYLYNVTSKNCKKLGRAKKITLNQVGTICEQYGLIPTGMRRKGKIPPGCSPFKEEPKLESGFCDHFDKNLEDPRSKRNRLYTMVEILFVTLVAIICGAEGWADIEEFGKRKISFLRRYFDYKNGMPSDDTFRRFFRCLNPDNFAKLFREWIARLVCTIGIKVIAIDGKVSKRSSDKNQSALHTVSAFATEARMVLGQEKVSDKSNEITAIPKLLEWLDISGRIITIDAMGCQYKIADQIVQKGGDYVFALKGNQESLAEDVKLFFQDLPKAQNHTEYDKGHGRVETRTVSVTNDVQWLRDRHTNWQTIKSIVKLEAIREIGDKKTQETRYYISSLDAIPETMLKVIRIHWGIESSLHWILDMSFGEDYSRIRKNNAPYIMTILRHMVCNMLQKAKMADKDLGRKSIKGLRKACGWDDDLITKVLLSSDFS